MDDSSRETILREGAMEVEGRLVASSNAALRVICQLDGVSIHAVYKPLRGERPLWDFPTGTLGLREVAARRLDAALGWDLIPTTVWNDAAPLGPGSVQEWVAHDSSVVDPVDVVDSREVPAGWHVVAEGEGNHGQHVCLVHEESTALRRLCALDVVMNNADRKGGHVLRDAAGGVRAIDHGLTFHSDDKVRTVLWGWAGEPIDASTLADLEVLSRNFDVLATEFESLLTPDEVSATEQRLVRTVTTGAYPEPDGYWPALPWPAM
jgi:uncharacterized repeat protein (TIGR03843 family)